MSDQGEEKDKDTFHLLFFHHPLPMWIYDLETLVFLEVNDAAMNKYGYPRAEFLSMSLADIHPAQEASRLLEDVRRKRPAWSHEGEWRHCLKDGTIIDVDITSLKIVFKGCQAALVTAQDITERKQGEQERNLLAHMLTNSLDEIYLFDADSLRFRFVNRGALNNLQFSLDQMQRMTPLDIKPELDLELFERLLEPLRRGEKQAQVFETVHRRADGTLYPVEVHLQWFGDQGVFLAVILDITKRVQAEEALRKSEERLRFLLDQVSNIAVQGYKADGTVLLWNKASEQVYGYTEQEALGRNLVDLIIPPEMRTEVSEAIRQMVESGAAQPAEEISLMRKDGSRVPVYSSHTVIEVRDGRKELYCIDIDLTERKRMEEALRESEARNRAILNAFPDLMFILDREGTYLDYLAARPEMLFVPPEQFLGKKVRDIFPPELASDLTSAIEKAFATGEVQTCEYLLPISGQSRAFEARIVLYGCDKVLSIIREVTDRVQAEQALKESEARFAAIFHTNPGAVALTRLEDNRLVDVNSTWLEITGYTRAEAIDHSPVELNLWVDIAQREHLVEAIRQHGKARSEMLLRRKTGEARDLLMSAEQVELDGKRYLLTMAQDISERKQAEEALRVTLAKYQTLFDSFPLGITVSDGTGKILETNRMAERLLGVPQEEHTQRKIDGSEWQIVRPDGTPMPAGEFASVRALKEKSLVENSELGIVRPDGSITWMSVTAAPLPLEGYGVVVTYGDITERKRAEEEIKAAKSFLEMIVHMSPFSMWISDKKGTITRVNRSLCESINLTETEIVGKYNVLKDENLEIQGVMPAVRAVFEKHEPARFSIPWKAANAGDASLNSARDMHIDVSMFPILNTKGELTNVVCQWVDITERKRAEEEIRQRSEELAAINAFGREVNSSLSLSNTTASALNGIMEAVQPDLAYLFLREGQTLILKETLFRDKGAAAPSIPTHLVGECMCGLAAQENRAIFSRDVFTDRRCTWDECKKFGVKSFAALPLRSSEEVFGVIGFGSLTECDFEQQAEFLETLASQVSAALVNAHLFETVQEHAAQLEQRVEERTRELQEAQEKLLRQERLAVMGQLAGGVGHELRNPLGVINNAVYYLRLVQPEADEKVREYLGIIEAEARNADKIITDLLDFSRVKSVEREPVSAQDLLARALERFPAPRGVRVNRDLPEGLPLAYVDARQIIQVLGNLTVNACQAMRGKGKLDLIARSKVREGQAYLAIAVRDNGPGIPPENIDKLFEPLFTTKPKGIGLGLAVSQKLAEANQGWIEVASQVGKGATFTLYLPAYEGRA